MPSLGPYTPASVTDDASRGTQAWSGLGNVRASDDTYASANTNNSTTHRLRCTDFRDSGGNPFRVPPYADNIVVGVGIETGDNATMLGRQDELRLVVGGQVVGDNKANAAAGISGNSGADIVLYFGDGTTGGAGSLPAQANLTNWGCALTPFLVNLDTFGLVWSTKSGLFQGGDPRIDQVRMWLYWDEPTLYSPAFVTRKLLVDLGLGIEPDNTTTDWQVYSDDMPDIIDPVIVVLDTTGVVNGRNMVDGEMSEYPGIQIQVRSREPQAGWSKARQIALALDQAVNFLVVAPDASARWLVHSITRSGNIIAAGKDRPESERNLFTINATISLKEL